MMAFKYTTNNFLPIDDLYNLDPGIVDGQIFYKSKNVGQWELSHDDKIGSYILKIVDGQEFHDHYCDEDYIIKKTNLK
jgi:hypothetical protein